MSGEATPVAAAGISYSAQVDEKRSIVIQTHIPLDMSNEYFNGVLDKFRDCTDRQLAYHEAYHLRRELKARRHQLDTLREDLLRIDRQEANKVVLNSASTSTRGKAQADAQAQKDAHQQQVARENAVATLKQAEENIFRIEAAIKEQEAIYNADASATDCSTGDPNS